MNAEKAELRKKLRAMGPELSGEAVCGHILAHRWFLEAETVMAYRAMGSELCLDEVIEAAWRQGKRLLLPRCQADGTMTARTVSGWDQLERGAFGIMEPKPEMPIVLPGEIDLVLVPAMAYDKEGRRLGRGKGYYDRFLKDFDGRTIGVSGILIKSVPTEAHDIPVDAVASEDGLILCGMEGEAVGR